MVFVALREIAVMAVHEYNKQQQICISNSAPSLVVFQVFSEYQSVLRLLSLNVIGISSS
jgi:hypothetical protein